MCRPAVPLSLATRCSHDNLIRYPDLVLGHGNWHDITELGTRTWHLAGITDLEFGHGILARHHGTQNSGMAFRLCYEEAARGKKVKVSTGAANEPAIRLYKQLGFAETGRIEVAPGIFLTNMERSVPDK